MIIGYIYALEIIVMEDLLMKETVTHNQRCRKKCKRYSIRGESRPEFQEYCMFTIGK